MINGFSGWIHVVSALVAMATGAGVVFLKKGTPLHKKVGWVYVVSMMLLNASAFSIFRLFGGFGPFQIAALISLFSLTAGMSAVIFRKPENGWLEAHRKSMSWSVVGLYAAFVSETGVRFFEMRYFWPVVVAATVLVMAIGVWAIYWRPEKSAGAVSEA